MPHRLKLIAYNLLFLVLGLVVVELILGNWFKPIKLGSSLVTKNVHFEYDVSHLYPSSSKIHYHRDKNGFRGMYASLNQIDILTVGGSTTDQRYIDDALTYQAQLAKKFSDHGRSVSVVNAGIDGQTTLGHIRNFDVWFNELPDLKPRWFLYYLGVNDKGLPEEYGAKMGFRFQDHREDHREVGGFRFFLAKRSAIYQGYLTLRGFFFATRENVWHGQVELNKAQYFPIPKALPKLNEIQRGSVRGYEKRLRRLFQLTKEFSKDSGLICVTQTGAGIKRKSSHGKWVTGSLDDYVTMAALNASLLRICGEFGGVGLDLANELEFEDGDFYDAVHTTPSGAKKISEYLFQKLEKVI